MTTEGTAQPPVTSTKKWTWTTLEIVRNSLRNELHSMNWDNPEKGSLMPKAKEPAANAEGTNQDAPKVDVETGTVVTPPADGESEADAEKVESPAPIVVADESSPRRTPLAPDEVSDMNGYIEHLKKTNEDMLTQLVGGIVTAIVKDENSEGLYGLRITLNEIQAVPVKVIAWIQADPEGNGPGFLSIEDDIHG